MTSRVPAILDDSIRGLITVEGPRKEGSGLGGKMMRLVWMTQREILLMEVTFSQGLEMTYFCVILELCTCDSTENIKFLFNYLPVLSPLDCEFLETSDPCLLIFMPLIQPGTLQMLIRWLVKYWGNSHLGIKANDLFNSFFGKYQPIMYNMKKGENICQDK